MKALTDCITCLEGFYCASTGLTAPTGKCAAGYYCKYGSTTPTPSAGENAGMCKMGYYCPEGTPIQIKCPVGTYGDSL